jgi:hypothetical protein
MATGSGSIEVTCDSPSYGIVKASRMLGLESPEDVRWCKRRNFRHERPRFRCFLRHPWQALQMMCHSGAAQCSCGRTLPLLEEYAFQLSSGRIIRYRLGQCLRCRTVYWDDV